MAVNLTLALATGLNGFVPDESGFVKELVTVVGSSSSANDTGVYTTIMKQPLYVSIPCCSATISGQTVTALDEVGLGSTTVTGAIYGYP